MRSPWKAGIRACAQAKASTVCAQDAISQAGKPTLHGLRTKIKIIQNSKLNYNYDTNIDNRYPGTYL